MSFIKKLGEGGVVDVVVCAGGFSAKVESLWSESIHRLRH